MQYVKLPNIYVMQTKVYGSNVFYRSQKSFAFDSLDHSQLLNKYGFRGPIFILVKDYLTNRWQFVFDNESITEKHPVFTGVPQGSILWPFLLIYINDLPVVCSTKSKIAMLADDTSVLPIRKTKLGNDSK